MLRPWIGPGLIAYSSESRPQAQRVQVVALDLVDPVEQGVEVLGDAEVAAGQAVCARAALGSGLIAGDAVDPFAEQVRVAVVACVLLDHVLIDPAQRGWFRGIRYQIVETATGHGSPCPFDAGPVVRQILIRLSGIKVVEICVGIVSGVVEKPGRPVVEIVEPGLHLRHVPDEPEK